MLVYKWFYNATRGTCDQFLYGGCDGNTNRFSTFEECRDACEISGIDPCMEPLDRGNWCEAMSNRYYFNKRTKQCKGFHYTGCGKSGNNFNTQMECVTKCEVRYPRTLRAAPPRKKAKEKLPTGYSGVKPPVKTAMIESVILKINQTYHKSEPIWADYSMCLGYRYNVSGMSTVLHVHLCALDGNADCISEQLHSTYGETFCQVMRPFLRGTHLYSWYFFVETKPHPYIPGDGNTLLQPESDTIAVILQMKANHCYEIC